MSLLYRAFREMFFSQPTGREKQEIENLGGKNVEHRLNDCISLINSRHGWLLADRYDFYLGTAILNYGECCETEVQFLLSLLGPSDNIVEIGANFGYLTVPLSKYIGSGGKLIAVEPQERIFYSLCANIAMNQLDNVRAIQCGCGELSGVMIVPDVQRGADGVYNSGGVSLVESGAGREVEVFTVDYLSKDMDSLRLLKIDVEGMERLVLGGARVAISKFRPILYVENDRVDRSKELIQYIISLGYKLWWHVPKLFNDHNYFRLPINFYGSVASFNMVCIPIEAEPPVAVFGLHEVYVDEPHPLELGIL